MKRKKVLRWAAAVCGVLLAGFTVLSSYVYNALLPQVEVYSFLARDTLDVDDYSGEYWVPEGCIFSRDERNNVKLYRVEARDGIFELEHYVVEIDGRILREGEGKVEVDAPAMYMEEMLVSASDKPLKSGDTVLVLNPEVLQE